MTAGVTGPEHNKQLVRRIVEEMFNLGRLEVAHEIFGPDFVDRGHESMADKRGGPEGFAHFVKAVREALPDISATIQTIVAEGDYVAMWNTAHSSRGTVWNGSIGETNQHEGLSLLPL